MSAAFLSGLVVDILCKHQGCLSFAQLDTILGKDLTVARELFLDVLKDSSRFVVVQKAGQKFPGSSISPASLIVAKTSLRVCQKPNSECNQCEELHICKYYLCGNCRYRNMCKNSHDIRSPHNGAALRRCGVEEMEETNLCWLLLQNDDHLLPEICMHYNKGTGEHGSCRFKESCANLHVCQHFFQGECKFGASCKRTHKFDNTAVKILNKKGFSQEKMCVLPTLYKHKFLITNHTELLDVCSMAVPVSPVCTNTPPLHPATKQRPRRVSCGCDAERSEICLYFIRKHCSFKDKCIRVHYHLPYKWELLDSDGTTWRQHPLSEDVEKAFCNPHNSTSTGTLPVNFDNMTCNGCKVRRLSTASSVTKPPHFIYTTEWLWYWKDDQGKWTEYGQQAAGKAEASINSKTLENLYLAALDTQVSFTGGSQEYLLNFKDMYQINKKYSTIREVRRRPRFISMEEEKTKLQSGNSNGPDAPSGISVPSHWDKSSLPTDFGYKLVKLSNTSEGFKQVEQLFTRTMPSSSIQSIQRIQNLALWRDYQWQKEKMQQKNRGKPVDQRLLFHGTDPLLIQAICEQNFDWRICGAHGISYGKGSYFARDAAYSDKYCKSSSGRKTMFVAQVLVGEFTRGNSTYLRPPEKSDRNNFYDSCVDNERSPAIFVIFEKQQIYPEFLIEYC